MSTQLRDGGMIFPKDEGVGDWKGGKKFKMGRAPFLEKYFLNFLGQENTKNDYLSLALDHFTFPSQF